MCHTSCSPGCQLTFSVPVCCVCPCCRPTGPMVISFHRPGSCSPSCCEGSPCQSTCCRAGPCSPVYCVPSPCQSAYFILVYCKPALCVPVCCKPVACGVPSCQVSYSPSCY